MQVKQLIGPYAGQIQEMDHHIATACIANGTACLPDENGPRIRGQATAPTSPSEQGKTSTGNIEVPDDWATLHHATRKKLAKSLTGETYDKAGDADAAIRAYLDSKTDADPEA